MDYLICCEACGKLLSVAGSVDETWNCEQCGKDTGELVSESEFEETREDGSDEEQDEEQDEGDLGDDNGEDGWCSWCNRDDVMRAGPPEGEACPWCRCLGAEGATPRLLREVAAADQMTAEIRDACGWSQEQIVEYTNYCQGLMNRAEEV